VKVLDFGISKSTVEQVDPQAMKLTGNIVLGSPAYMSPEQVRNASGVDGRSDVWSLGVSMYELLTGRMPFNGTGVGEILAAILEANHVPVHELRPEVPRALSDAITRCLRRHREERWADVGDLARAIAPFGTGTWTAYPERIAATLVNARQLRPPTPLGAFAVTSLAALVVQAEVDPLGPTQPPPSGKVVLAEVSPAALAPTVDADRRTITQSTRRQAKSSRWFVLAAGLTVAGAFALVVTRARDDAAAAAAALPTPPPPAPVPSVAPSAVFFVANQVPAASPGVSAVPAPSTAAASSAHKPSHKAPGTGTARPAILHSRN